MKELMDFIENTTEHIDNKIIMDSGFTSLAKVLEIKNKYGFNVITEKKMIEYLIKRTLDKSEKIRHRLQTKHNKTGNDYKLNKPKITTKRYGIRCDVLVEYIHTCGHDVGAYYQFKETLIEDYNKLPPDYVIQRALECKDLGIFDELTVLELESKVEEKDPFLLGRLKNQSERFFICQWDDDILLDDLI